MLNPTHGICFTRPRLPIGKHCSPTTLSYNYTLHQGKCGVNIQILGKRIFIECVIKAKGWMVQIFGNSIDTMFGYMYPYRGIDDGYGIMIFLGIFLGVYGTFSHTNTNFRMWYSNRRCCRFTPSHGRTIRLRYTHVCITPLLNKANKVDISGISCIAYTLFFIGTLRFEVGKCLTSRSAIGFHPFNGCSSLIFGHCRGLSKVERSRRRVTKRQKWVMIGNHKLIRRSHEDKLRYRQPKENSQQRASPVEPRLTMSLTLRLLPMVDAF